MLFADRIKEKPGCPFSGADRPTLRWLRARVRPRVAGSRRFRLAIRPECLLIDRAPATAAPKGVLVSAPHAFAIEIHDRSTGIVVAQRGGFQFFAAERAFQTLERHSVQVTVHAARTARRLLAELDKRRRY